MTTTQTPQSAAVVDVSALPGAGIKPWLSLQRHPRAAWLVAVLVLLVGLPIAWIRGQSHFNSEAVFQVAPTYMKNLDADKELELQSNSQYREFVNHLSNTVVRQDVLERAVADLKARGIDLRPPALTERKYIEFLRRTLDVRAVPDTYMVRIGTDADDPAHLHDLINAVATAFAETTRAEQIFGTPERLQSLRASAEQVSAEIAQASAAQPADRAALAALSQKVLVYAEGIQQARANNRQGLPVGAQYLKESSAQLRSEALPIANALVGANRARAESEMSANSPGLVAVFGALALGGLFLINRQMAAAFRRQVNLGVAAAALAVLVTTVAAVWLSAVKDNNVTTLRQGDFKVAVAAAAARTAGNDARSNEALRLIARGSGAAFEAAWVEAAATTTDRLAQVGQTDAQDQPAAHR